jgi:hypothetical protein
MLDKIEKKIIDFTRLTGLTERHEMVHGTLYVTLVQPEQFDHFHKVIRTFYKDNINPDGGVNMYAVGDEFCFDFVPEDREAPVFAKEDEQEKGVWSEFAEEDLYKNIPDDVEVMLNLEAEAKEGR